METHDDRDFEMGAAAEREQGAADRPGAEQRTGDETEGREGRESCDDRRRRHRRHRHRGRKERVLHTRVSDQLSDDIKRLADDLRVPASNLVRNVLEEVFAVVETVSDDVGDLFDDLFEEADAARERLAARERPARGRRRRRHSRHRSRRDFDAEVEEELSEDERHEQGGTAGPAQAKPTEPDPAAADPAAPDPEPAFPDVLGWQPLVLNHARTCASCGVALGRGHRGFIGLTAAGLSDVTLCRACVGS